MQDFDSQLKVDKELLTLSTDFKSYKFSGVAVINCCFCKANGPKSILEIKGNIEFPIHLSKYRLMRAIAAHRVMPKEMDLTKF